MAFENQFDFSLYVCAKEIAKIYKQRLGPYGLTYTGYLVMEALWEEDKQNVKQLGEALFLDSGTLTPLLRRMEDTGMLKRTKSTDDERNLQISLTRKGKRLQDTLQSLPADIQKELGLSDPQLFLLQKALHQLMEQFH